MRKTVIFVSLLFCVAMVGFAQNADFKYYTDYEEGFSGYACAYYVVNVSTEAPDLNERADEIITNLFSSISDGSVEGVSPVTKVTLNNEWLIDTALGEWDGEVGDFFFVVCADSLMATNYIVAFSLCKGEGEFAEKVFSATQEGLGKMILHLEEN